VIKPFRRFSDYDFRHWVSSQAVIGNAKVVARLFDLKDGFGRNAWFSARSGRNEVPGYVADLSLIQRWMAERTARHQEPADIAAPLWYALIAAAIADLASAYPRTLAQRCVQTGVWTSQNALAWARLSRFPEQGAQAVAALLRNEHGARRNELGFTALSLADEVGDRDGSAQLIADMAEDLPPHLLERALELVANEPNEGTRLGGLRALAPKLTPAMRVKALEAARRIMDPSTRLRARLAVAAHLDGSVKEREVDAVIAEARNHAARAGARHLLIDLADGLPSERVRDVVSLLPSNADPLFRDRVLARVLQREAASDPHWTRDTLSRIEDDAWRDCVQRPLALAWATSRCLDEVEWTLADWKPQRSQNTIDFIVDLIRLLPLECSAPATAQFDKLDEHQQVDVIEALGSDHAIPPAVLRAFADRVLPKQRIRVLSAIAGALPVRDLEMLVAEVCALKDPSQRGRRIQSIATAATANQVHRMLSLPAFGSSRDQQGGIQALLLRLVELGRAEDALVYLSAEDILWNPHRSDVLEALAASVPDAFVERLAAQVRPGMPRAEHVLMRGAIARWLPPATVDEIVQWAAATKNHVPGDTLAQLLPDLPTEAAVAAASSLLDIVERSVNDGDHYADGAIHRALEHLACVFEALPRDAVQRCIALAAETDASMDEQITRLMSLVATSGASTAVQSVLRRAMDLASQDGGLMVAMGNHLLPGHAGALRHVVECVDDEHELVCWLQTAERVLDRKTLRELLKRVERSRNHRFRLAALDSMLPNLPLPACRRAVKRELTKSTQWKLDAELVAYSALVLAPAAPDLVQGHADAVRSVWEQLQLSMQCLTLPTLVTALPSLLDLVPRTYERCVDEENKGLKFAALDMLAPCLESSQIAKGLDLLDLEFYEDMAPARTSLAVRAAELGDWPLLTRCLKGGPHSRVSSHLIERAAPRLPKAALRLVLNLAERWDVTSRARRELAIRAAAVGEVSVAVELFAAAGAENDEEVVRLFGAVAVKDMLRLMELSARLSPRVRATGFGEMLGHAPAPIKQRLTRELTELLLDWRQIGASERKRLWRRLGPSLARMSHSRLLALYTRLLADAGAKGQQELFEEMCGFVPALATCFGHEFAAKLDAGMRKIANEKWH
jgi:hypothetical protein